MTDYTCFACGCIETLALEPDGCSLCGGRLTKLEPGAYEVRTSTLCRGWVNCWHEDEDLQTFDCIQHAQDEIDEHIEDLAQMRKDAGEEFDEMHEREQLRIYCIGTGEAVG